MQVTNKRALLIYDDSGQSGIWAARLRQIGLEVVSLDLQAKDLDSLENRAFDTVNGAGYSFRPT